MKRIRNLLARVIREETFRHMLGKQVERHVTDMFEELTRMKN